MNDSYQEYINAVHLIFEKHFTETYKQSNAKNRARLLPYISNMYRRWYYASLVEDTLLTPANLVESVNRAHDRLPDAMPVVRPRSETRFNGLTLTMRDYTLANHPVMNDLKQFIRVCGPDIDLDDDDCMTNAQSLALAAPLSQYDPHYASYLLDIALIMGLVVKIPSIYANRAQVAKDAEARLETPSEALFSEIVEASIKMTAQSLCNYIMLPEPVFNEPFIRSLLKKPMETDDIFQRVYDMMGITLEDLFEQNADEEYDGFDEAFLSGTYMMGVLIDKYFFTPFGHYLKLIRPLYALPFDFESEIRDFTEAGFEDEDLATTFFTPCSRYHFTDLGLAYFGIKPTPYNYVNVRTRLPFQQLKEQLFQKKTVLDAMPARRSEPVPPIGGMVYAIKIKSETDPTQWLNLEIPADVTLHRLYLEAATRFGLNCNGDYSFFHDRMENPFAEYASPKYGTRSSRGKAPRTKKTADTPLDTLDFQHKQHMILAVYNQYGQLSLTNTIRLILEFTDFKPREAGRLYPSVTRMSKGLKDLFEAEE